MQGATRKSRISTNVWRLLLGLIGLGSVLAVAASDLGEEQALKMLRYYHEAQETYQSAPTNATAAWQLGRACFDLAEFSTNDTQRATLAKEGINACLTAINTDPKSAPAHYYLAMNRGQLARTMSLGALKLVHEMEDSFEKARALDPKFDHAGPDRNLGLLYLEAPGWPVSVGSKGKAKRHLSKAAEATPDFPENRLNLMEAYAKWGKEDSLRKEWESWKKVADEAHAEYSGERWRYEWQDWNRRLDAIKQKLGIQEESSDMTTAGASASSTSP